MGIDAAKEIGTLLRDYRERAGLSTTELSKQSGVNRSTLSKVEHGGVKLPKSSVTPLADALGLSSDEREHWIALADKLPKAQRLSTKNQGVVNLVLTKLIGLVTDRSPKEIDEIWVSSAGSSEYDVIAILRRGGAVGLRVNEDKTWNEAHASEKDLLPPPDEAGRMKFSTRGG